MYIQKIMSLTLKESLEQLMDQEPRPPSPYVNSEIELGIVGKSRSEISNRSLQEGDLLSQNDMMLDLSDSLAQTPVVELRAVAVAEQSFEDGEKDMDCAEASDEVENVERDLEPGNLSSVVGGGHKGRPGSNMDNAVQMDLRNVTYTISSNPKPVGGGAGLNSPTSLALGSVSRQPAMMALEELPDSAEFFAGLQGGRATTSSQVLVEEIGSQVLVEEMEDRDEGQRMSSVEDEDHSDDGFDQYTQDDEVDESCVEEKNNDQLRLEAHLATARPGRNSDLKTVRQHESLATLNFQDGEDGGSHNVDHPADDAGSRSQAVEEAARSQVEMGDHPTPQAKATGSNSRFKIAGDRQELNKDRAEERDNFEHEEERDLRDLSTLPATASGSGSKVGGNMLRHGEDQVDGEDQVYDEDQVSVEHHEEGEIADEVENDDVAVDHADEAASNQGEDSSQQGTADGNYLPRTPTRTPAERGRRTLMRKPTVWVKDKVQEEGPKLLGVGRSKDNQVVVVLQGLPSDIDSDVEMVRTSLTNGAGQALPTREDVGDAFNQETRQDDLGGEEADDEGGRAPKKKLKLVTVPAPKKGEAFNRKFRAPYSRMEEQAVIDFFLERGGFCLRKGIRVWRRMEEENICPGRSALALKHQFLQHVMKRLGDFGVTEEELLDADYRYIR